MQTTSLPNETYTIRLPQFEGPFDLLLFFIERDELDIYNIPIARITDDFLTYIHALERIDVDLASEFILVAAQLMSIKARMLLPRKQVDEEGAEIDPRHELVERLLEYKQYKAILEEMRDLEENRQFRNARGFASDELHKLANKALADVELESLTLFKLLQAFEKVMNRYEEREKKMSVHQVVRWPFTIGEQQTFIFAMVKTGQKVSFESLFAPCLNRVHAIVTFLALLELLNQQIIDILGGDTPNQFWVLEADSSREPEDVEEE